MQVLFTVCLLREPRRALYTDNGKPIAWPASTVEGVRRAAAAALGELVSIWPVEEHLAAPPRAARAVARRLGVDNVIPFPQTATPESGNSRAPGHRP